MMNTVTKIRCFVAYCFLKKGTLWKKLELMTLNMNAQFAKIYSFQVGVTFGNVQINAELKHVYALKMGVGLINAVKPDTEPLNTKIKLWECIELLTLYLKGKLRKIRTYAIHVTIENVVIPNIYLKVQDRRICKTA